LQQVLNLKLKKIKSGIVEFIVTIIFFYGHKFLN